MSSGSPGSTSVSSTAARASVTTSATARVCPCVVRDVLQMEVTGKRDFHSLDLTDARDRVNVTSLYSVRGYASRKENGYIARRLHSSRSRAQYTNYLLVVNGSVATDLWFLVQTSNVRCVSTDRDLVLHVALQGPNFILVPYVGGTDYGVSLKKEK